VKLENQETSDLRDERDLMVKTENKGFLEMWAKWDLLEI